MSEKQRDFETRRVEPVRSEPPRPEPSRQASVQTGSLVKVFAIVFVAALAGSFVGNFAGMPITGEVVKDNVKPTPDPTPAPTPQPRPPSGGSVDMASLTDDDAVRGNANAPVTIVEFSDFQCPFCGRSFNQYTNPGGPLQGYIDSGKVKFIYRDFPLSFHENAESAAIAAECAGNQGKFYEFHDLAFGNQGALGAGSYKKWAADLGLDTAKFNKCVDSKETQPEVQKDFAAGSAAGVSGTPTFFIGKSGGKGQKIVGAQPWNVIKAAIDANLA